jgi:hypothetical protein
VIDQEEVSRMTIIDGVNRRAVPSDYPLCPCKNVSPCESESDLVKDLCGVLSSPFSYNYYQCRKRAGITEGKKTLWQRLFK